MKNCIQIYYFICGISFLWNKYKNIKSDNPNVTPWNFELIRTPNHFRNLFDKEISIGIEWKGNEREKKKRNGNNKKHCV